ncbi:MAG: hypothetical protein DRP99_06915 [Candidatus Latescibacterota bacterium]|nr:MAG: hypothetical protein DRP99_06915 [Candidatus Latescibacterota bacterium]
MREGIGFIWERSTLRRIFGTSPDEKRGRVFGVLTTICGGLQPLGYGMGGKLADLLTVPVTFVISGTAVALGGISLYRVPVERRPR